MTGPLGLNRRQAVGLGTVSLLALNVPTALAALSEQTADLPAVTVYRDPSCNCCTAWADRLRTAGFLATVIERTDMGDLKKQWGVPQDLASCHTAQAGNYVLEGHVPPDDIKRLVTTKPAGRGLAVPGMPMNSPGMEVPGAPHDSFTVWLFQTDGTRSVFATYPAKPA